MIVNDNKRIMLLTLIVVALVVSSPVLVKWMLNQDSQISSETYYNLRIIEQIKNEGGDKSHIDDLQNNDYNFNFFLFLFSKIDGNMAVLAKLLPVLMGIFSMILFYILLRNLNLGQDDIFFSMIILMTSPIFLYSFTTFSPEILALPVFLLGFIFYVKKSPLSSLFFGATAFLNIFYLLIALAIVSWNFISEKRRHVFYSINIFIMMLSVVLGIFVLNMNYLLSFVPLSEGLNGFIIEFGAIKGYALIAIGLAFIGLFSWWNREKSRGVMLVSAIVLIIASLFFQELRLGVALIMAAFAGFSISYLSNREWEIYMLKGITLLLVFCILFFSAILSLNYQTKEITDDEVSAAAYIASAGENDRILSAERNGFIIEYASGRSAYLDENSYKFRDYDERKIIADSIFYASNMRVLEETLKEHRITHILVDSEMKSGEIWNGRSEGLLFFLENSNSFIKIFYNDDIQIYRYVGNEVR